MRVYMYPISKLMRYLLKKRKRERNWNVACLSHVYTYNICDAHASSHLTRSLNSTRYLNCENAAVSGLVFVHYIYCMCTHVMCTHTHLLPRFLTSYLSSLTPTRYASISFNNAVEALLSLIQGPCFELCCKTLA